MRPHISVIIVNYNSGSLLKRTLDTLDQQTRLADRVIVVDNNSQDSSLDDLPELPGLEIIRAGSNLGFAKANNLAVGNIHDSDYLVLLNPDAFADKKFLQVLIETAEKNPQYHSFAAKMIDDQCREFYDGTGDDYHISGRPARRHYQCRISDVNQLSGPVFSSCGGAAMYRASSFKELGGFDESFFCYLEDIDLGFRMQLHGYACFYVENALVYHMGSAITGRHSDFSVYYGHRNLVWTYFKNMPLSLLLLTLPFHLLLNVVTIIYFFFQGKGKVILRAKRDALSGFPEVWKQRQGVQHSKVVSNYYIWSILNKNFF
ncbi:MAG: glycosyltransferase family 2 protein [gamma proteobacterium symbiont of Taylorina sp.]|nr:glycosyltransferase family 2 protein [gamma proteobacterium symbiont of Taylorina sp.]